jgi:hypothetical protein
MPEDLSFQPKDLIPDIVWAPGGLVSAEDEKVLEGKKDPNHWKTWDEVLCRACGWNVTHELSTSYLPRVRIHMAVGNKGLWSLGNDWMLWDQPNGAALGNDFVNYQFLKSQGVKDIPLLQEMKQLNDSTQDFQLTLMSRAKGVQLSAIWQGLPLEEKKGYALQVSSALRELRQFTSSAPQRVDGGPIHDTIIAHCNKRTAKCKSIGATEEWFAGMAEELRYGLSKQHRTDDEGFIEAKLQDLKVNFPDGAPYVLTHGDLNLDNIMVRDGKIVAIIDWEHAGYYPWWAERYTTFVQNPREPWGLINMVWAELTLGIHLDTHRIFPD